MRACNVLLPGGINGDCTVPLQEVKNVLITDRDVSFSYTNKNVLSNWTNLIKQDLTIYGAFGLDSYENTTDDPNIVTESVSKSKVITNVPMPSFVFYLKSNFCDFKAVLNALKGGNYGVFYELQDGTILGTIDTSGTEVGYFKPFKVNITANTRLLQEVDSTQAFRVYINHTKKQQLYDQFLFEPTWDVDELIEAMPVGLNMVATGVYASGDIDVQVNVRCGDAKTGLVVGDFDESSTLSNVDTPAVTAITENGGGAYTLTIQKGVTPANLVDGDYVSLRVKVLDGSDVTHISNYIRVEGIT